MQALKERQETELKQGRDILHSALETALDYKVGESKAIVLSQLLRRFITTIPRNRPEALYVNPHIKSWR